MNQINLPFKVGETVETKSFLTGYRGTWFQCKILKIIKQKRILYYMLKYIHYPDEEIHKTKVYEKPRGGKKNHLMVRPIYPPLYHESEFLKVKHELEEPLVVVHESWKVGDLVDWRYDDCFWSGTIVEVVDNETFQVELLPKPIGEGEIYEASLKDLRPRLEWSLEDGWKVPLTEDGRQCAKLIKPKDQVDEEMADVCEPEKEETKKATQQVKGNGPPLKLNIMESDSIEAAVLDLEELIVRIEWLKEKLKPDGSEGAKSSWKFEDYRPSSTGR